MSSSSSSPSSFPLYAKVVLQGLQKAPELNGKDAVIQTALGENGRQQVYIASLSKTVNIKPANLLYQDRPLESLSVKELKRVLEAKQAASNEDDPKEETAAVAAVDKSELQAQVQELTDSPQEIAEILAIAEAKEEEAAAAKKPKKKTTKRSNNNSHNNNTNNPQHMANAMENMSPEQLRQQAHMLRTTNPTVLRAQNPQLAHMTDAQIRQAAQQFEMMANNPAMRKQALDQMKHMSPEQVAAMGGGGGTAPPQNPAEAIANMTPEQMRQQAQMLKTMDPDTIRRTNPQLAHMSNDQIQQAAAQFEMMANNPDMMKMAMDQMKNMTPEQMDAVQRGEMPPANGDDPSATADPAAMLANMDKTQLKQMLRTVKDNPDMIKQFAKMTGSSEEATQKSLEAFANMDDAKLDMAVTALSFVQKLQQWWKSTSTTQKLLTVGGMGFAVMAGIYALVLLVIYVRSSAFSSSASVDAGATAGSMKDAAAEPVPVVEDEFGEL